MDARISRRRGAKPTPVQTPCLVIPSRGKSCPTSCNLKFGCRAICNRGMSMGHFLRLLYAHFSNVDQEDHDNDTDTDTDTDVRSLVNRDFVSALLLTQLDSQPSRTPENLRSLSDPPARSGGETTYRVIRRAHHQRLKIKSQKYLSASDSRSPIDACSQTVETGDRPSGTRSVDDPSASSSRVSCPLGALPSTNFMAAERWKADLLLASRFQCSRHPSDSSLFRNGTNNPR